MPKKELGEGFFGVTFAGATKKNKGGQQMEEFSEDVTLPNEEAQEKARKSKNISK